MVYGATHILSREKGHGQTLLLLLVAESGKCDCCLFDFEERDRTSQRSFIMLKRIKLHIFSGEFVSFFIQVATKGFHNTFTLCLYISFHSMLLRNLLSKFKICLNFSRQKIDRFEK